FLLVGRFVGPGHGDVDADGGVFRCWRGEGRDDASGGSRVAAVAAELVVADGEFAKVRDVAGSVGDGVVVVVGRVPPCAGAGDGDIDVFAGHEHVAGVVGERVRDVAGECDRGQ